MLKYRIRSCRCYGDACKRKYYNEGFCIRKTSCYFMRKRRGNPQAVVRKIQIRMRIIEVLNTDKEFTRQELVEIVGCSLTTIKDHIKELEKEGIVETERVGRGYPSFVLVRLKEECES